PSGKERYREPRGQGRIIRLFEAPDADLPTDVALGLAARQLNFRFADTLFSGVDLNGRAVADPSVLSNEVVGGTELEQVAFQHLKVRAGITPQGSQSHFPALVGGPQTGLLNTTPGERGPGAQDFGLGRSAPVGAAGDDLVGGLGQRYS